MLDALESRSGHSLERVLDRGFALVTNESRHTVVKRADQAAEGATVSVSLPMLADRLCWIRGMCICFAAQIATGLGRRTPSENPARHICTEIFLCVEYLCILNGERAGTIHPAVVAIHCSNVPSISTALDNAAPSDFQEEQW